MKLFESIKSPMKLRIFESGVKVVCSASLEQGKVCEALPWPL